MILMNYTKFKSILAQITPNRNCNLRCKHCFISNEHKALEEYMSEDGFHNTLDFISSIALAREVKEIQFDLMGGELSLLPESVLEFYIKTAIDYWSSFKIKHPEITVGITVITNFINVTPDYLNKFLYYKEYAQEKFLGHLEYPYNFLVVTTSYEPDTNRFVSEKQFLKWKESIKYLTSRGMLVGTALTGTSGTLKMGAPALYKMLVDELNTIPHFDYLSLYGDALNHPELMPTYDELVEFMKDFYTYNIHNGTKLFDYREPFMLENLNSRWYGAYSINFDGTISMDSESSADEQYELITNASNSLNVNNPNKERLLALAIKKSEERLIALQRDSFKVDCVGCDHVSYCQGGYIHYEDFVDLSKGECTGFKPFLDFMSSKYWSKK